MSSLKQSFDIPKREPITKGAGMATKAWDWFFQAVFERLYPLGVERSFALENNQSSPADIEGLRFDKRGVSMAAIDYLVRRLHEGTPDTELVESGTLIVTYYSRDDDWDLVEMTHTTGSKPNNGGITFSITSNGQVQYETSDSSGPILISRIFWRTRTLAGKSNRYSALGTR